MGALKKMTFLTNYTIDTNVIDAEVSLSATDVLAVELISIPFQWLELLGLASFPGSPGRESGNEARLPPPLSECLW